MGIWKLRTSPYHTQTNRQVEWAHQLLMCIIGKLSKDWKVDLPKHLPELIHVYNPMRLAITRYIPYYLMIGCQPCLPIDSYFPIIWGMEKHQHVDYYLAKLHEQLWETFKEVQAQSMSEADRSSTMTERLIPFCWKQVTLSWLKLMPTAQRGKWRTGGRRNHIKWNDRSLMVSLHTSWGTGRQDTHKSSTKTDFFSSLLQGALPSLWLSELSSHGTPPPP